MKNYKILTLALILISIFNIANISAAFGMDMPEGDDLEDIPAKFFSGNQSFSEPLQSHMLKIQRKIIQEPLQAEVDELRKTMENFKDEFLLLEDNKKVLKDEKAKLEKQLDEINKTSIVTIAMQRIFPKTKLVGCAVVITAVTSAIVIYFWKKYNTPAKKLNRLKVNLSKEKNKAKRLKFSNEIKALAAHINDINIKKNN